MVRKLTETKILISFFWSYIILSFEVRMVESGAHTVKTEGAQLEPVRAQIKTCGPIK